MFSIFAGHRGHRQNTQNIHGMFVASVMTKRKGAGFMVKPK